MKNIELTQTSYRIEYRNILKLHLFKYHNKAKKISTFHTVWKSTFVPSYDIVYSLLGRGAGGNSKEPYLHI